MEVKLNYYDEFQQLSSSQVFSDQKRNLNLPFIKNAQIFSETTLYLQDISHWRCPGSTLIIDTERPPHITNQSTRKLIRNFVRTQPCRDLFLRVMSDYLGIKQARPVVLGTQRVVPLTGTTRRPADWAFVHHLTDFYADQQHPHSSFLNFNCHGKCLQLQVPFKEAFIRNKLLKAQRVAELTYLIMKGLSEALGMAAIKPRKEVFSRVDHCLQGDRLPSEPLDETLIELAARLFVTLSESFFDESLMSMEEATHKLKKMSSNLELM
ncbi:hypothetical protein GBO86_09200 [Pediococcus acidilactici]|nr:hypothetical protein GBO86_09200 [Pediococcus acidilactici]